MIRKDHIQKISSGSIYLILINLLFSCGSKPEYTGITPEGDTNFSILIFLCVCLAVICFLFIYQKSKYKTESIRLRREKEQHENDLRMLSLSLDFEKKKNKLLEELAQNKIGEEAKEKEIDELSTKLHDLRLNKLLSSPVGKKLITLAGQNIPQNDKSLITDEIWEEIEYEINQVYTDFKKKIFDLAPHIVGSEWQYCCLHLFNFDSNQEAILLNINPESVRKRRLRIRQKLGISLNKSTLYNFFVNELLTG